jgi:hypothetical protein
VQVHDDVCVPDIDGTALAEKTGHIAIDAVTIYQCAGSAVEILDLAATGITVDLRMLIHDRAAINHKCIIICPPDRKRAFRDDLRLPRTVLYDLYPAILHRRSPVLRTSVPTGIT